MSTIQKIFALFILINVSACQKEKSPSPSGANTVTATVDGKPFKKGACFSCIGAGSALVVYFPDSLFSLTAEDGDHNLVIELILPSLKSTGLYTLSSKDKNFAILYDYNTPYTRFTTSNINTGQINITKFDHQQKIIAGTFEFSAADNKNPTHTVTVTKGNFDVTYK